ncbi:hypothetical protein CANARDRAFT_22770 [[Candida] arabinofermentans NRRL YB-2248]|uniref:2-dehydropantoate 2-reductase n=1 Tax=[Candida] arabinofermentans NRRL YB-2248 TaxID=983967 RepID=A0A1E4T2K8_9ASCO|nr:hypothetical protein CANARDRAFT_22770 [[Candida] arabinofermentans NRRL YB-2248]
MTGKPKILLIGMGGVGSIAAYSLTYTNKSDLTVVVRSEYNTLKTTGFEIKSIDYGHIESFKPYKITNSISDAVSENGGGGDGFEYIIITTKNIPDITPIETILEQCYDDESENKSTIVLLQNGFGIEKSILKKYKNANVISIVTMISSSLINNVVNHVGSEFAKVGYFPNGNLSSKEQELSCFKLIELYSNEKNKIEYDPDVKWTRWRKLMYNATINPISTLTDCDIGRLNIFGGDETLLRPSMIEIINIAKSDGCELPYDAIDSLINSDPGVYYSPSMLVDRRKGNYVEYINILGNALDVANENNIEAPILKTMFWLLRCRQMKLMEEKGRFELPEIRPGPEDGFEISYKW